MKYVNAAGQLTSCNHLAFFIRKYLFNAFLKMSFSNLIPKSANDTTWNRVILLFIYFFKKLR